jgi:hypothetical protein
MSSHDRTGVAENVALAGRLSEWLRAAGVTHTEMAVDLADIISAAKYAESALMEMLKLDVSNRTDADEALGRLGQLHTWLFTEMKHHLEELEQAWPELETRLVALAPDDPE